MDVQLILVPYDTARRDWRSGAGPAHLLRSGIVERLQERGHRVGDVRTVEADPDEPPAEIATGFDLMRRVALAVRAARAAGRLPLVLSGNCNVSVGTLSGLTPARRAAFWFDAHGDLNTPDTTTSGFLDGTGLAIALGMCWHRLVATVPGFQPLEPERAFLLGARDLDPPEVSVLERSGMTTVPVSRLPDGLGEELGGGRVDGTLGYIHLDPDVLDPDAVGRANSLPVPGGLTVEQLTGSIARIRERVTLGAVEVASYAPEFDSSGGVARAIVAAVDAALA